MIINGNPAKSVSFWSKHLLRDDTNERAEVKEIVGLLAEDLPSALKEMQAVAAQSRCHGNFMYQANINPRDNERLTPEQWKEAVDTLEKNLGLDGHQRVVVEHVKNGRQHYHVVWNRVDVDNLRVADIGGNWRTHEKTARELEIRFGLEPTPPRDKDAARKSALELYEIRAAERTGVDPVALKAELTELWNRADSGKAFAAAIEECGYVLAKGDRRDFCVIDQAGDAHSLARRLDGVRAKDVRERMADIDRDSLPSVAEARDVQRARMLDGPAHTREAPDRTHDPATRAVEQEIAEKRLREVREAAAEAAPDRKPEVERAGVDRVEIKDLAAKPALAVIDSATGLATGLASFIGGVLNARSASPNHGDDGPLAGLRERRRALAAMENLRQSLERGERLKAEDIQNLTPSQLENIRLKGDDYLRSIIASNERNRPREIDWGRGRER